MDDVSWKVLNIKVKLAAGMFQAIEVAMNSNSSTTKKKKKIRSCWGCGPCLENVKS
jgi:hypothetical protein